MSEWKEKCLGDLLVLQRGHDLTEHERRSGQVPIFGSAGVHGYHDTVKAKGPGVVIGRSGASFGVAHFSPTAYWPHNTVLYVTDFKGNDERFTYYLLKSVDFSSYNSGSAQPSLNRNYLYPIPIRLPSLETQRKIASILSAYDDLIENNTRRIKILEEMAQALYREWFVNFRFPGHEQVKLVDSPLGMVPDGWEVKTLGEVCSLIKRGVSPKYDDLAEGVVINQKCIRAFKLSLKESRKHNSKVPVEKYLVQGDVLINSTGVGTLGRVAQVLKDIIGCTVDSHVTIVRPSSSVDADFLGLQLFELQGYFESLGQGATGQTELGREAIANTGFVLADMEVQKKFSTDVKPMRILAERLAEKNQNLLQTRDLLLPKLIAGEVDVSELAIQAFAG